MLVKLYGADCDTEATCSPPKVMSRRAIPITGDPDPKHISTSYVERHNQSMRMSMRRFARLIQQNIAALPLYFMFYNFCRIHQALRVTPAMEAGIADHVWDVEEIVALLQQMV